MQKAVRIAAKSLIANVLPQELFRRGVSNETARKLFQTYVRVVEIENHSYCNRTCSFCPNAFLDRRSQTVLMTDALFEKLLRDLASIDYSQSVVWSRYHEPMADPSIYARVAEVRRRLPNAHLVLVSNGDYLNDDNLKRLEAARVNRLLLDLYLTEGKERDPDEMEKEKAKFSKRTGLKLTEIGPYHYRCDSSTIKITMGIPYYTGDSLSSRGGLIPVSHLNGYTRTAICLNPLHSVVIDYNGKGMLCCQVRSDAPSHADAIIGDLSRDDYSLFDFYRDLAPARAGLLAPGPKEGVCKSCTISNVGPDRLGRRESVAGTLGAIPGFSAMVNALARQWSKHRKWE